MEKSPLTAWILFASLAFSGDANAWSEDLFADSVAPILARRCLSCHGESKAEADLSLTDPRRLIEDGYVEPDDPSSSQLLQLISPVDGRAEMPKDSDPLTKQERALVARWIKDGATIPERFRLEPPSIADRNWWSLRPIQASSGGVTSEWIDDRIDVELARRKLDPLPVADPITLVRRITYDLTGLPPTPQQVDSYVTACRERPNRAWIELVDRLLDSPEFGEKWGQHWLDLARYAETHGYDKDQPRNNAWPYRDYVIDSLNADKPFGQFVREQIAGDVLAENHSEGIVAIGFLAAGPWDLIAHKEVGEGKLDGRIAKHLDRDEMATAIFNVFQSTTIQCAQCHHHKFDPIRSEDYYRVHAVLAGVDRADRVYAGLREDQLQQQRQLKAERTTLVKQRDQAKKAFNKQVAEKTAEISPRIAELTKKANRETPPPQHGFHSTIVGKAEQNKWVQIDLGEPKQIQRIELIACYDDFNNIGAGFGFPVRFKVEVSDAQTFDVDTSQTVFDSTDQDFPNPATAPVAIDCDSTSIRWIRVTATKLAERRNDFILALAELRAIESGSGNNVGLSAIVTTSDHIPPNARWSPKFLVDDRYHRLSLDKAEVAELKRLRSQQQAIVDSLTDPAGEAIAKDRNERIASIDKELKSFPKGKLVYAAATDFETSGQFRPTGGEARPIHFLHRGDLRSPGDRVFPGAPALWPDAPSRFFDQESYDEANARTQLAHFISHNDNPLVWRSIVNRIWQWTFGKPLVDTPNDFGRMGARPTHPEILDALAAHLRDDPNQSIKSLIRTLVQTRAYRRASFGDAAIMKTNSAIDSGNDFLWKYNRRRLTAEEFRDTVLATSGALRLEERGGPSFKDFVVEHPQHSPHYEYHLHDPNDPKSHRRTIYRFVVRSQPQPMLTTLDCADPSISIARRDESTTALQALTQWNNRLVEAMSVRFSKRLDSETDDQQSAIRLACRLAWGRAPSEVEHQALLALANKHGAESLCRVILNSSAMMYVE